MNEINTTSESLKQVRQKYNEQNYGLFGLGFEDQTSLVLQDDFTLPACRIVQFRRNIKGIV